MCTIKSQQPATIELKTQCLTKKRLLKPEYEVRQNDRETKYKK